MEKPESCQVCGSSEPLERHHLVPQLKCKKRLKDAKDDPSNHVYVCPTCHRTIHAFFDERELRYSYNTLEALLGNEKFSKYVEWRRKHLGFSSDSTKMSNDRRRKRKSTTA